MIEHPCLASIIGDKLRTVARAIDLATLGEQRSEVITYGTTAVTVYIRSEEVA
jgi:hypothetical protein